MAFLLRAMKLMIDGLLKPNRFAKGKIDDLEDILRNGPEPMHYCAMICLRQFGFDNGQLGDGDDVKYYIYKNGETQYFVPKDKPITYDSFDDWLENGYGSLYEIRRW